MKTHDDLVRAMLKNPAVRNEYDALRKEFAVVDELLRARQRAGLTQAEVARRMGTQTPSVVRLERASGRKSSPTVQTLARYAQAVDCTLEIRLRPAKKIRRFKNKL